MSCFLLPVGICKTLCQIAARFWWGTKENEGKRIHWSKWDKLILKKEEGGLGFKDLQDFNLALIAKQLWRVLSEPNLLMSKVIKGRYFPNGDLMSVQPHSYDSWLWRNWMKAIKIMRLGVRFAVGTGETIRIWDNPWLPKYPTFLPDKKENDNIPVVWVSELMIDEGRQWNKELIQSIFSPEDSALILQLPVNKEAGRDKVWWHHDKKGQFSVNSAYKLLQELKEINKGSPGTSDGNKAEKRKWQVMWKLGIKNKIKHFLWRCNQSILPTSIQLRRRGMNVDEICQMCGEERETIMHVFFHCTRAKQVWKLANVSWDIPDEGIEFREWWSNICTLEKTDLGKDRIALSTYILWWLWKTRNLWMFQQCRMPDKELVDLAYSEWNEFNHLGTKKGKKDSTEATNLQSENNDLFEFPEVGQIEISVSAVWREDRKVGWGCIAKSQVGKIIKSWNASRDDCKNPVEAYLLALRDGQLMAFREKWKKIIFKIVEKDIVNTLTHKLPVEEEFSSLVEDIYLITFLFDNCLFTLNEQDSNIDSLGLAIAACNGV
ncbi:hypothetical protein DH2020_026343 [Rehmannia glutinosa]|uniref:Reverse transcriptase zinc-binding domain-containing protein n=1 Tax=Rehmannia glutinosa TaxID=99300 RepID=A0ABR0VX54_REHGL